LSLILAASVSMAGAQDRVRIRWYVGLGAGTDAPLVAAQEAVVAAGNALDVVGP
jgi:hypothetical protein